MTGRRRALRRGRPWPAAVAVAVLIAVLLVVVRSAGSTRSCPAAPHLDRTAALLHSHPGSVRIAVVGDSTRDEHLASTSGLYRRLRGFQTGSAGGLRGVPPSSIGAF